MFFDPPSHPPPKLLKVMGVRQVYGDFFLIFYLIFLIRRTQFEKEQNMFLPPTPEITPDGQTDGRTESNSSILDQTEVSNYL